MAHRSNDEIQINKYLYCRCFKREQPRVGQLLKEVNQAQVER